MPINHPLPAFHKINEPCPPPPPYQSTFLGVLQNQECKVVFSADHTFCGVCRNKWLEKLRSEPEKSLHHNRKINLSALCDWSGCEIIIHLLTWIKLLTGWYIMWNIITIPVIFQTGTKCGNMYLIITHKGKSFKGHSENCPRNNHHFIWF